MCNFYEFFQTESKPNINVSGYIDLRSINMENVLRCVVISASRLKHFCLFPDAQKRIL